MSSYEKIQLDELKKIIEKIEFYAERSEKQTKEMICLTKKIKILTCVLVVLTGVMLVVAIYQICAAL